MDSESHYALIDYVLRIEDGMTDSQRAEFWRRIKSGYCGARGCNDPGCPCENDE